MSNGKNVFSQSTCLIIKKTAVGTSRKIPVDHIEVDADKDRVGVNKSLLKSQELSAIKTLDGLAVRWIYSRSYANEVIASGVYLVKMTAIPEVIEYLEKYQHERQQLVTRLCDVYPALVASDRQALKSEFNTKDYPGVRFNSDGFIEVSKEALAAEFKVEWEFKTFVTPDMLKVISPALYEQALAKEQLKVSAITDEVIFGVREEARKLVEHLLEKLTPSADGKAKVLHTSSVEKVQDFLSIFDKCKNLGDDTELSKLIAHLRESMSGVTKDALKQQPDLRSSIQQDFQAAKVTLDSLLVDKPKRMFKFETVVSPSVPEVSSDFSAHV